MVSRRHATRLNFSNTTFGDPVLGDQLDLGHLGLNGPIAIRGTGTVDLIEVDTFDSPSALLGSQAKSFTLAALTFYGLGAGSTPVTLTTNSLADQNGALFGATTVNASVTIAPVPLPPAMWLLASSLLGLAVIRFRSVSSQSLLK